MLKGSLLFREVVKDKCTMVGVRKDGRMVRGLSENSQRIGTGKIVKVSKNLEEGEYWTS